MLHHFRPVRALRCSVLCSWQQLPLAEPQYSNRAPNNRTLSPAAFRAQLSSAAYSQSHVMFSSLLYSQIFIILCAQKRDLRGLQELRRYKIQCTAERRILHGSTRTVYEANRGFGASQSPEAIAPPYVRPQKAPVLLAVATAQLSRKLLPNCTRPKTRTL